MDVSDVLGGNLLSDGSGLEELLKESPRQKGGKDMSMMEVQDPVMLPANKDSGPEGNE